MCGQPARPGQEVAEAGFNENSISFSHTHSLCVPWASPLDNKKCLLACWLAGWKDRWIGGWKLGTGGLDPGPACRQTLSHINKARCQQYEVKVQV